MAETGGVKIIKIRHRARSEYLLGVAPGDDSAVFDQGHPVRDLGGNIHIMEGGDHGNIFTAAEITQDGHNLHPVLEVKMGRGLIQQKYFRFLGQGAGHQHLLPLSVAEAGKVAPGQVIGLYRGQ